MSADAWNAPRSPHVVIVGAGFGGLNAARELMRHAGEQPLRVTLVDRNNYHTFQPLLYQVATAGLQVQDVGHSVRDVFRGRRRGRRPTPRFRMGTVREIDWDRHHLLLSDGSRLRFDLLVLAAGATTADYGIPGVDEHAFKLKSLAQALALRNHILTQFERSAADPSAIQPGALTFVVAGGGPTGVELAGALSELAMVLRDDHPELVTNEVRIVLVEMRDALLGTYRRRMQRYARDALLERGVEVRLDTAIAEVHADGVRFDDGEELPSLTLIWSAGVRASPLADVLGVEQERSGRVPVDASLRLPEHPEAFVVGDIAGSIGDGPPLPQLAPVAIQQGRHVGRQIARMLHGEEPTPFRYRDRGNMATIGRHDAVVELPAGIRFRGFPAWIAWLFLHLLYLVGFRNRVSVFGTWLWSYLTFERAARVIVDPAQPEPEEVAAAQPEPDRAAAAQPEPEEVTAARPQREEAATTGAGADEPVPGASQDDAGD